MGEGLRAFQSVLSHTERFHILEFIVKLAPS